MRAKRTLSLFSIALFFLFIYFSYLVGKETFTQIDFDTTVKLQDHIARKWDLLFSIFSILGSAEITVIIWLLISIFAFFKRFWLTLLTLPLFFLSAAIEVFGKLFVYHPGPPHLFYRGVIKFDLPSHLVQTDYSYPSGHMTRTAFLTTFLIGFLFFKANNLVGKFIQLGLIILLLVMAVSRVYLGEHWLSDVIGGMLLGTSMGIFTSLTIPAKRKEGANLLNS